MKRNLTKLANSIEGFLHKEEGELLYNLAKECPKKSVIVEIGSFKGKSTVFLGAGSKAGNKVKIYAIDPHTGSIEHRSKSKKVRTFEEFKTNIKKTDLVNLIIPILNKSKQALKDITEPIGLLFIDGSHEYKDVLADFELWYPKVVKGGIIAMHDTTNWPGPKKVADNKIFKSGNFKNVNFFKSISYGQKTVKISIKETFKNRYLMFLKNLYGFTTTRNIPQPLKKFGKYLLSKLK